MAKIDKELVDIFFKYYNENKTIDLPKDFCLSLFTKETLKNAIYDCENIYGDNFEANRKRKMRLSKLINEKIALYPINNETLSYFDDIRYILVHDSLFSNMSDFCNLEINEKLLSNSLEEFEEEDNLEFLRNQCYKDLFILRILWFSNSVHKLLTELPLPENQKERTEFYYNLISIRGHLNNMTEVYVDAFLNNISPKWLALIEINDVTIKNKKQKFTEFASNTLKNVENLLLVNGYNKNNDTSLKNLEKACDEMNNFFEVMENVLNKTTELQEEDEKKNDAEKEC